MSPTPLIRLVVHGAEGRMGARVCALAREDARFDVMAGIDRLDTDEGRRAADDLAGGVDVVVDFSVAEGAAHAARLAAGCGCALLVATTGLSAQTLRIIEDVERSSAVMIAPNTSFGVAVMNHLAVSCARLLGGGFDIDLVETHHAAKRDAPSGTALRIAESVRRKGGADLPAERVHSLRSGDVIGDHEIIFSGPGERIKISHQATNRDLFARGALRAAAWLAHQPPGRYSIDQAHGLANGSGQGPAEWPPADSSCPLIPDP
jgi:4-hydroxy-tetrahydrodipicolinate reductase